MNSYGAAFVVLLASLLVAAPAEAKRPRIKLKVFGHKVEIKVPLLPVPPQVQIPAAIFGLKTPGGSHSHPEILVDGVPIMPPHPGQVSETAALECVRNLSKCPQQILGATIYAQLAPIVDAYKLSLNAQAVGKVQALPSRFVATVAPMYGGVDLNTVRYATGIDTIHKQAITIDNFIYFPGSLDLSTQEDVTLMVHELEHVLQYKEPRRISRVFAGVHLQGCWQSYPPQELQRPRLYRYGTSCNR